MAGNVGTPLAVAGRRGPRRRGPRSICECSSFQLEDSSAFAPECAVFLNLAPDHLDRHGTIRELPRGEAEDLRQPGAEDVAVYNGDEPVLVESEPPVRRGGCAPAAARLGPPGAGDGPDGELRDRARGRSIFWRGEPLISTDELRLLGAHNVENAMAAAAAALALGLADRGGARGPAQLRGRPAPPRAGPRARRRPLRQRLEGDQRRLGRSPASRSFEGGVHLILGGSLKGETFERLAEPVRERCVACYLIGEAAAAPRRGPGRARAARVSTCSRAAPWSGPWSRRRPRAQPGEVVLLSPACASFDQFRDFEAARRALPRAGRGAANERRPPGRLAEGPRASGARRRSSTRCC